MQTGYLCSIRLEQPHLIGIIELTCVPCAARRSCLHQGGIGKQLEGLKRYLTIKSIFGQVDVTSLELIAWLPAEFERVYTAT